MEDILSLLIPIIGVSIPLVVVAGKFIIQPIVQALARRAEIQAAAMDTQPLLRRLEATEDRLAQLEKSVDRVLEEQEFQGRLLSGRASTEGSGAVSPPETR